MQRLSPMPSASKPMPRPSNMPATCTADSKKPASSSPICNASRSTGSAGNSLATCSAALTPAKITTTAGVIL